MTIFPGFLKVSVEVFFIAPSLYFSRALKGLELPFGFLFFGRNRPSSLFFAAGSSAEVTQIVSPFFLVSPKLRLLLLVHPMEYFCQIGGTFFF